MKSYQKDKKLTVDGVVGAKTWAAILADTVDNYDDDQSGEDEAAKDETLYTVIIEHLLKAETDELDAKYNNVFIELEE